MAEIAERRKRVAKLVGWATRALLALDLSWMMIWRERTFSPPWFSRFCWPYAHWPVRLLFWWFWMPEPPTVLGQVALSFLLSIPIFLFLLLLMRVSLTRVFLGFFTAIFAIAGYPFFALRFPDYFMYPQRITGYGPLLLLETMAVLSGAILFYLRKLLLPSTAGVLLLLLHFGLWAWLTGNYVFPSSLIAAYPTWWRLPRLEVEVGICVDLLFYFGFPVIGLLSALSSGLDLKLSSDRTPRAT